MKRRRLTEGPRKTTRRWHIPPPLVHGSEPLEGGAVLEELPGHLGLLLWQALRDVLLWSETTPGARAGLFASGAADARRAALVEAPIPAPCHEPLVALSGLVDRPESVQDREVAAACAEIAAWAEASDALATALAFAQDAALVATDDSEAALSVARLAARRADHARAEIWFRRALGIARRGRDWRTYTRAFAGLGSLYRSRGNLPGAQRFHVRALRGARRGGLRLEQATALHDLFAVAVEAGRAADAERLARQAFEAYGARNPRVAVLAHDVAYHWMEQGHFARALAVFQAVLPLIQQPVEHLWAEADVVRAAAGAGEHTLARRAASTVLQRCDMPELAAGAPRALLEVGRGLFHLGDMDAAESTAERALQLATERRDGRTRLASESLLDAVRRTRTSSRPVAPPLPAEPQPGDPEESFAEEMIHTLRGLSAESSHR